MNITEKQQADDYIQELEHALEINDLSTVYDICAKINAIYRELINIESIYEEMLEYNGLVRRNANVICALLKDYVMRNYDSLEKELVNNTRYYLKDYPKALEQYNHALRKFETGNYERNTLDDIRLSLELLLKDILHNGKSLENQLKELGSWLNKKRVSTELRNMITTLLSHYTKYQNGHVKHDNNVNRNEIEIIIELTSSIMKFSIKTDKEDEIEIE